MLSRLSRINSRYAPVMISCTIVHLNQKLCFSTVKQDISKKSVPVGTLVNNTLFDTLIRKPYQKQQYNPRHISNLHFTGIITKHAIIDTALVVCCTLGACTLASELGWLSSSFTLSLSNPSYLLNRIFPFLLSISDVSMRNTFQLMAMVSPFWISGSAGLTWLGCRRELRKVYKQYEEENEKLLIEEKPGFIQHCSLEDGCSMRFYGDECEHGNGRIFTKKSMKSPLYDGYGGDCSFKASKNQ